MRISVSAAVFCVLFALQIAHIEAAFGPVLYDATLDAQAMFSASSSERRSTLSFWEFFSCLGCTFDGNGEATCPGTYKGCGTFHSKTGTWCTCTDSIWCPSLEATTLCAGAESDCCELNAGLVAGIVIGITVGLTLLIVACAWCCKCCCFKRKVQPAQPGVVMMQPGHVMMPK
uniref:Uncharacterized protein n=1 Tax=Micromonas pusilla TaxID=38833 RepID=A0A6U0GRW8_MICPS|mmetsp:Transcript_14761/g.53090  ORF Transcript_14761/g.53090 Transcript_14761/m.53090 type:complete len:173 (+) Transcript_14761:662-1180(+)